jgi:hypothetical protein
MGGKFREITQVFCILVLALSLSLATAVPMMAAEFASISPDTLEYDLDDPAEVMTTIDWGIAEDILEVTDDDGDLDEGINNDYIVLVKHLIILDDYLASELTDIGDSVELIIEFDVGAASLTITAVGTQPSISPKTADYDLDDPADAETTVTWGIASDIHAITENGNSLTEGVDYTVGATVGGEATLTILDDYLDSELTDIDDEVELTIEFDFGEDATFTITAIGTKPSIDPTTAKYNIDSPADVKTTITWGSASDDPNDIAITENSNSLTEGVDYTVGATVGGEATLTILDDYLDSELTDIGDDVVLTINFNVGGNATFEITATGTNAGVSPQAKNYDLDNPADVSTTIIWNTAEPPVVSITENGHDLTEGLDYTVGTTVGGEATLTILDDYLEDELTDIGDKAVLTIEFDRGANATFTITAIGIHPKVSPTTEEYDLDNPADATTTITWHTATEVASIVDDDDYALVKDTDYTVTSIDDDSATLTIFDEPYLEGKHINIGDSVVLTIDFNVGTDATFTITPVGVQASIYPVTADHDVIEPNDVTTTITWGSATSVVSIVDDDDYLLAEGMHYTVTPITSELSANLTIFSSTYLADKLGSFGEKLVLTISFDVGRDATLTITVPEVCFIATAAYDTPMAEEIQILRDFRDEYLLTNPLGQALAGIYYRVSPPIAEFITEHPNLKPIVRAGLLPAVAMSTIMVNTSPVEKVTIIGLLVLVSVGVAIFATRRRGRGPECT